MIEIYHNPRCSKSRMGVKFLEEKGLDFKIVKYLDDIPSKAEFQKVLAKLDIPAKDLVRTNEAYFKEKLKGLTLNEDEWIDVMLEHPKLIERPIIIKDNKAVIGRPAEKILEIL